MFARRRGSVRLAAVKEIAMSTENGKRQRRRSTRVRRASSAPAADEALPAADDESSHQAAREHYRREKARRAARARPPEHPLEQARRAYHALLASDAERARGGRPRKTGAPAAKKQKGSEPDAESQD
jgi:hypothetical protein